MSSDGGSTGVFEVEGGGEGFVTGKNIVRQWPALPDNAALRPENLREMATSLGKSPIKGTFAKAAHSRETAGDFFHQGRLAGIDGLHLAALRFS
ncbi:MULTISPECIES: hypothetical protein [Pseudomonas]|uniref:hypothetical protein n=1 Tax=Pseudomonas TaxID=286 RepID=UPI001FAABD1C|nr:MULTISPECIES: hypothetical protein [Pseudomonas]MCS4061307.1 hypothetical protein [Pseudomonas putida]